MLGERDPSPSLPHSSAVFVLMTLMNVIPSGVLTCFFGKMRFVITIFPDGEYEIL